MMKALLSVKWYLCALILLALVSVPNVKAENSATTPVPRAEKWWTDRHESMNARVKQGKRGHDFRLRFDHAWLGRGR